MGGLKPKRHSFLIGFYPFACEVMLSPGSAKARSRASWSQKAPAIHRVPACWKAEGYLAHKKSCPPHRTSIGPRHSPTVGTWGGAVSYERGTPVEEGAARAAAQLPQGSCGRSLRCCMQTTSGLAFQRMAAKNYTPLSPGMPLLYNLFALRDSPHETVPSVDLRVLRYIKSSQP